MKIFAILPLLLSAFAFGSTIQCPKFSGIYSCMIDGEAHELLFKSSDIQNGTRRYDLDSSVVLASDRGELNQPGFAQCRLGRLELFGGAGHASDHDVSIRRALFSGSLIIEVKETDETFTIFHCEKT